MCIIDNLLGDELLVGANISLRIYFHGGRVSKLSWGRASLMYQDGDPQRKPSPNP